ncbi:aldehyde dehydrogenase family protein [Agrococcus carbonis]|uniref:Aldehyde dehydrogenase n=1 Tax=Agrococcus carbonis TaxID=684552 RepID=A0A1H1L9P7_9MICO|nr:aldehyde dehydrogenase family protein [Agrococcus carbonis]SDR71213.1 aldehyde dehydrogenase (NAD+) [Agrococcus carbonis]
MSDRAATDARPETEHRASVDGLAAELREAVTSGVTRSREHRAQQLDGLVAMLLQHTTRWEAALRADLGKSEVEAHLTEIGYVVAEARAAKRSLRRWMAPTPLLAPLALQPAVARTVPEPLGAALIIGPWNYPVQLVLAPLVGAIATGCAAVVKPSEVAPATSALLAELAPQHLDARSVRIVEGGVDETTALLEQRWDLVFYTGNAQVARVVAAAAAKHLTPTVLELGGKSPAYVHRSADIPAAARRIAWGKWLNAGQTCVAPDHIRVDREVADELVEELRRATAEQLGDPRTSPDYARIVNTRHLERLRGLLSGGTAVIGGEVDADDRYVAPTILTDVDDASAVMQEEIFGPILPVLPVDSVDGFIETMRGAEKPLALYVFARDADAVRRVERETSSGALGINIAVAHVGAAALPFGGVGESGTGAYHGKHSFDAFSHHKAVLSKPTGLDTLRVIYPPFSGWRARLARRILG